MKYSKKLLYLNLTLCVLLISVLIYGFFNRYNYETISVSIESSKFADEFDSLKLVAFSDAHLVTIIDTSAVRKLVDLINSQNPDIVCFLGDMTSYNADELLKYKNVLKNIKSKYGIYAILGNHDYGVYQKWNSEAEKKANLTTLIDTYRQMGWQLLLNNSIKVPVNGDTIIIAGTENWGVAERFPKLADMNKTIAHVDPSQHYTILMTHDPNYWDQEIITNHPDIDLTLSGHTHGGQMGIKCNGEYKTIFGLFAKYSHGLYQTDNNQQLYVTMGVGEVGYPGRIGLHQEVAVLNIKHKK